LQDFDFAQILIIFAQISPKFAKFAQIFPKNFLADADTTCSLQRMTGKI